MPVNTKQTLPPILILFLIIVMGFQIFTAIPNAYCSDWQHIGDNEGVSLYRSLNETEGLLPFKADAELEVPYERIVMTLVDAEGKPDWAPKLKAMAIHSQISSNHFVYSEYYKTPWPFKDRCISKKHALLLEKNINSPEK